MPSIDYFECEDCGFRWKDQGPLLFCLNEDGEIEEYILIRKAYDLDRDSLISGDIVETYCVNCDRKIKLYIISVIRNPSDEDEAISLIENLAKENRISNEILKPFIKSSDLKDDCYIVDLSRNFHSSKKYHCPSCDSEIPKYILSKNKCPKCNGEIKVVDGMCLDKF
ncbi:hypothetical protein [Methanobrevibacter sp.]|uniref:hypothetical protein n=1 Tax=Methanobrevibacter sp. TaxID=66852 RepID=UPI0025D64541|nr:hypothetical protein [Methanobrevibacter sp.]MBQ2962973.1 hypothetical protein [Methanobrevibacter sp.]